MIDALEAREIGVRFGQQVVLRGLSLLLETGEKALLTGPSGCGKSTVLRCFLGFVVPETGSVHIEGKELPPASVWSLRRQVAYVAQEPDLGTGTAQEAIERPFHFRANVGLRGNLGRVPELFERFRLDRGLLDKDVGDLSGGEKQRIALISAILLDRPVFLLDEITSALDKASKQAVSDYFRSREDATMLAVTHDPEAFSFVPRVIELAGNSKRTGAT